MAVYVLEKDTRAGSLNRRAAVPGFAAPGEEVVECAEGDFDDLTLDQDDILVGGSGYERRVGRRPGPRRRVKPSPAPS